MATVKKSNKKKIIAAISIVLVIAIIGTVIGVSAKSNKKETVSLTTIGTGEISESVSATGTVSAGTTKEYKVGAVATVKEVFVKVGDKVTAGDKLATFDTSALDSQRKQLSGTYQQAKKSYKQSVSDQKTAKKNLADVNSQIEDAQKQLEKLEREAVTQATSRVTITFPSTTTTTRPTTTRPTTAPTSATTTTTTEPVTYPATVEGLVQALTDLVNTLNRLSNDIETTNALVRVVMQEIANQLESGNLDPERIAQAVGDAVAKAIKEGIIDETKLIIESGVAVDMIEAAVKNIDWSAVGSSIASSPNVQLATAQLNLAALYAQQKVFQLEASDDTVYAKSRLWIPPKARWMPLMMQMQSLKQAGQLHLTAPLPLAIFIPVKPQVFLHRALPLKILIQWLLPFHSANMIYIRLRSVCRQQSIRHTELTAVKSSPRLLLQQAAHQAQFLILLALWQVSAAFQASQAAVPVLKFR